MINDSLGDRPSMKFGEKTTLKIIACVTNNNAKEFFSVISAVRHSRIMSRDKRRDNILEDEKLNCPRLPDDIFLRPPPK
jgi:hypothetical protein